MQTAEPEIQMVKPRFFSTEMAQNSSSNGPIWSTIINKLSCIEYYETWEVIFFPSWSVGHAQEHTYVVELLHHQLISIRLIFVTSQTKNITANA